MTTPACEVRSAVTQMVAIAGLATTWDTAVPMALSMPLSIGPEKFTISCERRGRFALASCDDVLVISAGRSILLSISAVILALSALCTAGSWMSGSMLATNRSVLVTWLAAHTPSTETGASTQPRTMSSAETGARQRPRACLAGSGPVAARPRRSLTSARSRSSSSRSSCVPGSVPGSVSGAVSGVRAAGTAAAALAPAGSAPAASPWRAAGTSGGTVPADPG